MTKKPKDNSVGPWAKEKLEALVQYLKFFTTVLKKQGHWLHSTIFFDAFGLEGAEYILSKGEMVKLSGK
jgi:hypothetical protein